MDNQKIKNLIESELIQSPLKNCCKWAFISGAIRGAGELNFTLRGFSLEFRHTSKNFINALMSIINGIYNESFEIERINLKSGYISGQFYTLYIPVDIAKELLCKCAIISCKNDIINEIPTNLVASSCCKKAYLRGLYLSCGYLNLPQSIDSFQLNNTRCGYELSFKLNSSMVKYDIKKMIAKIGKIADRSICLRKNSNIIYIKNSEAICNFFTAVGSNAGVLEIYQIITQRRMKNDINRANNLDLANIDKSLASSERQILAIQKLDEHIGLENLPINLQKLAALRLKHPDASLIELAKLSQPEISKSCINHRFRRIMQLAESPIDYQKRTKD